MRPPSGIVGLGTDVVDIARLTRLIDRGGTRFLDRWFRPTELRSFAAEADGRQVAALLAAKEAVAKALRVPGDGPLLWRDIEIVPGPAVLLHGRMRDLALTRGVGSFRLSMASAPDHAMATALAIAGEGQTSL
ncbi:holo-ACP synthase [Janibacter sp. YB324]|uniref:holo-ACP synthase n=1 Tax=Janibacter sp. YB324 TaxID=2761047 RepID=UPI0016292766|nr:holo-ACP synthase [Janibacter sp. YB324]QNF93480.1 holo-ACP synthase [Janibacter sp. YB324]